MWLALTKNAGTLDCVDKVFAKYRRHEDNISSKFDLMHKGRMQIINFFRSSNYDEAFSRVYLINAQENAAESFSKSIRSICKAFVKYKKIVFKKIFLFTCAKILATRFKLIIRKFLI